MIKWQTNQPLDEDHFNGTFTFPHDLDFLGEKTNCQFFCDIFNDMITNRINTNDNDKTSSEAK